MNSPIPIPIKFIIYSYLVTNSSLPYMHTVNSQFIVSFEGGKQLIVLPPHYCMIVHTGGAAVQKGLGPRESMMIEMGALVAVSDSCKVVAEERTGIIREPPYPQGFVVKITGES